MRYNGAVYPEIAKIARNADEVMTVRRQAVAALGGIPGSLPLFVDLYESRADSMLLSEVLYTMGDHGAEGVRYLSRVLQTETNATLRRRAVSGLRRSESSEAVRILSSLALNDEELRSDALYALESNRHRVPGAREALEDLRRAGFEIERKEYFTLPNRR